MFFSSCDSKESLTLLLTQARQSDRQDQQNAHERNAQTDQERDPTSRLIAHDDLVFGPALGQLRHSLDTPTHALEELSLPRLSSRVPTPRLVTTTILGNGDIREEVAQQRVLEDEARARDAEYVAEGAPELQRAGDDSLLAVRGRREHGDEGAGELEALPHGGRHEAGEVGPGRPTAAHTGQQDRADEEQDGPAHERPLEPAEARDQEPRTITIRVSNYSRKQL